MRSTALAARLGAWIMAAGILSGCGFGGGNGHQQLAETCIGQGEAPETCDCIVDAMEARLSPDLFKRTVVAVVREKRPVGDFILSLPDEEKMQFFHAEQEMETCNLSAVPDETE